MIANLPPLTENTFNLTCLNTGNMATPTSRRTQHVFMGGVLFRSYRPTSLEWLHWQDGTDNLDWWRGSPGVWSNRRATFLLGTPSLRWARTFYTIDLNGRLTSTVPTGTAPFAVASVTEVANLNTEKWHGRNALDFSASLDFSSIPAGACLELTVSVPGAPVGASLAPGWPSLPASLFGMMVVSANGTVTIRLCNLSAQSVDPPSQTFGGRVMN